MQLAAGQPLFLYIPTSSVICPPDKRNLVTQDADLEFFATRWHGKYKGDDSRFLCRRNVGVSEHSRICSVTFKKYSNIEIAKCSVDYYLPRYDLLKLGCTLPRLSVIIPVYNGEKYIRPCLDSVLKCQDLEPDDIEVICVDDGSTDSTSNILDEYRFAEPRLRIVRLDESKHAGEARNLGLRIARGRFVHFVDADDRVSANSYAAWLDAMEKTGADFSCARYREVDFKTKKVLRGCGRLFNEKVHLVDVSSDKFNLIHDAVVPWNKLYKKSFIIENHILFDKTVIRNDRKFYIDGALRASKVAYYSECVYEHSVDRSGSLVFQSGKNFSDVVEVFKNVFQICKTAQRNVFSEIMYVQFRDLFYWYQKCVGTEYAKEALDDVKKFLYEFCKENKIIEKCEPKVIKIVDDFEGGWACAVN